MKFRWNKNYLGWGLTAFAVIIASLLVYAALTNFKEIAAGVGNFFSALQPILYGLVIAYLLAPIVAFFETRVFNKVFKKSQLRAKAAEAAETAEALKNGEEHYHHLRVYVKNKKSRICSILVSVIILFGVIVGICFAILPQLNTTISLLVENIPTYVKNITTWVQDIFAAYPEIGKEITNIINEASATLKTFLTSSILPQMGDYLGFLTNGIMSIVGLLMNLIFGLVVSIYCLYSKELFSAQMKKFIYCIMKVKHANSFIGGIRKIHKSFGSFITGTLIDSFVVACITFIVTTIFGVPFALLVSVIMGITNIIPYFGPFIGIIPSTFLILMEDPVMCLVFIAIAIVIQNLNGNVLTPRILGESTGLSSFWVVFAILAGQGMFGFIGLIIGVPLFAVLYAAVKTIVASRLKKKGLPAESDHYTDIASFEEDGLVPVSLAETVKREQEQQERREQELKERKKAEREAKKYALKEKIGKGRKE